MTRWQSCETWCCGRHQIELLKLMQERTEHEQETSKQLADLQGEIKRLEAERARGRGAAVGGGGALPGLARPARQPEVRLEVEVDSDVEVEVVALRVVRCVFLVACCVLCVVCRVLCVVCCV